MSKKLIVGLIALAVLASLAPFALVARSRAIKSGTPAPHLVFDMDFQPKFKSQAPNPMFADGRAMRPHIPGTVAREDLQLKTEILNDPDHPRVVNGSVSTLVIADEAAHDRILFGQQKNAKGVAEYIAQNALPVTPDLMKRGQERFNIYCAPCHGYAGEGNGMVHQRAAEYQAAGSNVASNWVQPSNLTDADRVKLPDGSIYNTITNGIRSMPRYDKQISVADRWAIVAYVRALQRAAHGTMNDVPQEHRGELK